MCKENNIKMKLRSNMFVKAKFEARPLFEARPKFGTKSN